MVKQTPDYFVVGQRGHGHTIDFQYLIPVIIGFAPKKRMRLVVGGGH